MDQPQWELDALRSQHDELRWQIDAIKLRLGSLERDMDAVPPTNRVAHLEWRVGQLERHLGLTGLSDI